jgi:TRAP-type mannitol/chloroaromatic compound transport system substrate-binding protein
MNRRDFLTGGVAGLAVGGAVGYAARGTPQPKVAEAPAKPATPATPTTPTKPAAPAAPVVVKTVRELKMVTSWPKDAPGLGTAAQRFAQNVEKATEGRIKIKVFAAGELVPPLKCNDAVQDGAADLYHSADYYYQGKMSGYSFFTAVPAGFSASEINAWIYHGGGQALWDEIGAQFGLKHLPCGNTGHQAGGWFRKEIKSLDDLKGLKMRIPGLGGDVLKALGGEPVTLAVTDIMPAFEAGTVDAIEWIGPWSDLAFGFQKAAKNYYLPGFHEPGSMLSLGINKKIWDGFSETDRLIVTACAGAENAYSLAEFNANNAVALDTLVAKHDVKVREFSDELFKAIFTAAKDVVAAVGARDPLSKKVYDGYMKFRKSTLTWTAVADQAYFNKRALVNFYAEAREAPQNR